MLRMLIEYRDLWIAGQFRNNRDNPIRVMSNPEGRWAVFDEWAYYGVDLSREEAIRLACDVSTSAWHGFRHVLVYMPRDNTPAFRITHVRMRPSSQLFQDGVE